MIDRSLNEHFIKREVDEERIAELEREIKRVREEREWP